MVRTAHPYSLAIASLLALTAGGFFAHAEEASLLVSGEWLRENLKDPTLVILHVGTEKGSYLRGHIPGARFANWDDFVVTRDGIPNELPEPKAIEEWVRGLGISMESRVVIYDEEKGMRAARCFFTLDSVGLGNRSALLDGQLKAWEAANGPLSTEEVVVAPSDWRLGEGVRERVVEEEEILRILKQPAGEGKPKFMDSRSKAYFEGTDQSGMAARAGRLPDAVRMEWSEALQGGEIPLMRSPSDLKHLLEEKGVGEKDPVITYCNTGRSASHLYFTLRYLGFDTRIYDGSMSEWTSDESNPVEVGPAKE